MKLDEHGWLDAARQAPSPNCDACPPGEPISLIVIHNISLPPAEFGGSAVEELFTNRLDWDAHPYYQGIRGLQVSAHFFIRRDGEIVQFECDDAHHCPQPVRSNAGHHRLGAGIYRPRRQGPHSQS